MFRELATESGAVWAIASMLFFIGVWVVVTVQVVRARPEVMEARARMALEDESGHAPADRPDTDARD